MARETTTGNDVVANIVSATIKVHGSFIAAIVITQWP